MADEPAEATETEGENAVASRDRDLLGRKSRDPDAPRTGIRAHLDELFTTIAKGFEGQSERSDEIQDYWDIYNCEANSNRYYNGIADIYPPITHDAVEAIVTRDVNQLFPQGGRYVQAIAADGSTQNALVAILDHYIKGAKAKTQVAAPLVRNGQVEGQLNLYMDWAETLRQVVSRETHGPMDPQTGQEMPGEEIEDIVEEDVLEGFPVFEVLHDPDVLVLPATADSVGEALSCGGSVTIVRRWSKAKVEQMEEAGNIRKDEAKELKEIMGRADTSAGEIRNTEKRILEAVGIRHGGKEAQVWETWTMLPLGRDGAYSEKGRKLLCRVFFGPKRAQLGAKRNPYWNDRCPLITLPVIKMAGALKGPSPLGYVDTMQYEANDALNEGADAATLSAAPIVRRDPAKSDGPLVYNIGAVWEGEAGAIELFTFPDLTPRAVTRVGMASQAILQTLSVNPSMLPQQTKISKSNQAEVAQAQAVDLLTVAMRSTVLEDVLTEAAAWVVDLDYQFRDRELTVRMYGEEGRKAEMQQVPPLQNRAGFTFVWRGGEQVRQNMATQQAVTGMLNVMMNPQLGQILAAQGLKFTPGKIIQQMITNALGPELGSASLVDQRLELTNPPEMENEWMSSGLPANVHPMDDDNAHMQAHFQDYQQNGDPFGLKQPHMMAHQQQAAMKMQAQMAQQMMQQQQGAGQAPGGGRPPGASAPQPGASPAGPRLVAKQPPGAVHPDRMSAAGGIMAPRKM